MVTKKLILTFCLLISFALFLSSNDSKAAYIGPITCIDCSGDGSSIAHVGETYFTSAIPYLVPETNYLGKPTKESIKESSIAYVSWKDVKNNVTGVVEHSYKLHDKYSLVSFSYEKALDTFATEYIAGSNNISPFAPTQIPVGQERTVNIQSTIDGSISLSLLVRSSNSQITTTGMQVNIPLDSLSLGGSYSSEVRQELEIQYQRNTSKSWSYTQSYELSISNTPNSPYYHNGDIIAMDDGARIQYKVHAILVYEHQYTRNFIREYNSGLFNWYTTTEYEIIDTGNVILRDIYYVYEFLSYSYQHPFVYYFDSSKLQWVLFDFEKVNGVVYV